MRINEKTSSGIGVALNEAALLGVEYDPTRNLIGITFSVLTLPGSKSTEPPDPRRQIILTDIGRIAAALRESRWDDLSAKPINFEVSNLLSVVQSFNGQPIYGWEFINVHDHTFDHWKNPLSLDILPPDGSYENKIMVFQEGATENRHLDLWIWFGDLLVFDATGGRIEISDFIAGGKQWWDALHAGDPRTEGHGIVSGKNHS